MMNLSIMVTYNVLLYIIMFLSIVKNTLSFRNVVYDIRNIWRMPVIQSTPSRPDSEQGNIKENLYNLMKTAVTLGTTAVVAGEVIGSDAKMVKAEENVCRLNELILPELKYSYNGNDYISFLTY